MATFEQLQQSSHLKQIQGVSGQRNKEWEAQSQLKSGTESLHHARSSSPLSEPSLKELHTLRTPLWLEPNGNRAEENLQSNKCWASKMYVVIMRHQRCRLRVARHVPTKYYVVLHCATYAWQQKYGMD